MGTIVERESCDRCVGSLDLLPVPGQEFVEALGVATLMLGITILPNLLGAASKPCPIATGEFDAQAGASNQITTCKVLAALALVKQGKIVRLGRVYEDGIPLFGTREYNFEQLMPVKIPGDEKNDPRPTGGPFGDNRLIFNDGIIFRTEIDQVGTQFDGPGHIGTAIFDDPRFGNYFLDLPVSDVNAPPNDPVDGLRELGVEHVKPLMTRGILVDLAPFGTSVCEGEPCWDAGEEITLADLRMALREQGMKTAAIKSGDAVFFNTGWHHLWKVDNVRFNNGEPGIGLDVGNFLVEKGVVLVGADTWAVEVVPNPDDTLVFPVHELFIKDNGIFNHENLIFDELISAEVYQFMYVFVPVPFKGATGSPGDPIAVY